MNDGESASITVGVDIESNDRHAGIVWPGEGESERDEGWWGSNVHGGMVTVR